MRKLLSIIIPKYRETEKQIFPLLSSINGQAGIDFSDIEVIIAVDGEKNKCLNKDFLHLFDLDIRHEILKENGGPGLARQAGLDAAKGEYVMFCDADDALHNVGVLGALMQEAEASAADILTSSWMEELIDAKGNWQYITHETDNTWMHGKVLRRQFLTQNNIRFHESLRIHEDSYFLCIASSLAERSRYLPITSYIWKYHPDSITRKNGAIYSYESIPEFIRACSLAHAELEKRVPEQMEYKVLQFILYCYFCFHQPGWLAKENTAFLKAAEKAFTEHIKPFWHYWENAPKHTFADIYNQERQRSFHGCVESETVTEWAARLKLS